MEEGYKRSFIIVTITNHCFELVAFILYKGLINIFISSSLINCSVTADSYIVDNAIILVNMKNWIKLVYSFVKE